MLFENAIAPERHSFRLRFFFVVMASAVIVTVFPTTC